MGVFVTPQSEIDAYYASEALGQSKAKKLLQGLSAFTAEEDDLSDKVFIKIGKGVDMLLTGEEGEFEANFHISKVEKAPSDTIVDIIQQVVDGVKTKYNEYLLTIPVIDVVKVTDAGTHVLVENDSIDTVLPEIKTFAEFSGFLHEWEELIIDVCKAVNYQPRYGAEAKLKAIVEPGSEYFKDLCNSNGKIIIDANTNNIIDNVVSSLKTHPRTSRFFNKEDQAEYTTADFYYQLPIYFLYNGVECKALLDFVVVIKDINGDILQVQPIDLKTMFGNTFDFPESIKTRRYDIQAAWYTEAIYAHFCLDRENEDLVAPFKFIVESTSKQGKPLIFEMDKEYLYEARVGKQISPSYYVSGMDDIIRKFIYHTENGWELEQEIQEADEKGEFLKVNRNGIVPVNL